MTHPYEKLDPRHMLEQNRKSICSVKALVGLFHYAFPMGENKSIPDSIIYNSEPTKYAQTIGEGRNAIYYSKH